MEVVDAMLCTGAAGATDVVMGPGCEGGWQGACAMPWDNPDLLCSGAVAGLPPEGAELWTPSGRDHRDERGAKPIAVAGPCGHAAQEHRPWPPGTCRRAAEPAATPGKHLHPTCHFVPVGGRAIQSHAVPITGLGLATVQPSRGWRGPGAAGRPRGPGNLGGWRWSAIAQAGMAVAVEMPPARPGGGCLHPLHPEPKL